MPQKIRGGARASSSGRGRGACIKRDAVERSRIQSRKQAVADAERKLAVLKTQYRDDRLALEHHPAAKRHQAAKLADRREQLQARLERVDE